MKKPISVFIIAIFLGISSVYGEIRCSGVFTGSTAASPNLALSSKSIFDKITRDVTDFNKRLEGRFSHGIRVNKNASFPENEPAVRGILENLSQQESQDSLRAYLNVQEFQRTGLQLVLDRFPYEKTVRWVFEYLEAVNQVELLKWKGPGELYPFHSKWARNSLEEILNDTPKQMLVFDFGLTPESTILKLQASNIKVVGIEHHPIFVDGYHLSPLELAYHDIGHAWLSMKRDREQAELRGISVYELRAEAAQVILHFEEELSKLKKTDSDLAAAAALYLFEISHERGIPLDTLSLLSEFNHRLRVDSLLHKLESGFFGNDGPTFKAPVRIDEGRVFLMRSLEKWIVSKNTKIFSKIKRGSSVRISKNRPGRQYSGWPIGYKISDLKNIDIQFKSADSMSDQIIIGRLQEVSLAQVPQSKFEHLHAKEFETLSHLVSAAQSKSTIVLKDGSQLQDIEVNLDAQFMPIVSGISIPTRQRLKFKFGEVDMSSANLDKKMDTYEVFRLRQLLTLVKDGKPIPFVEKSVLTEEEILFETIAWSAQFKTYVVQARNSSTGQAVEIPLINITSVSNERDRRSGNF